MVDQIISGYPHLAARWDAIEQSDEGRVYSDIIRINFNKGRGVTWESASNLIGRLLRKHKKREGNRKNCKTYYEINGEIFKDLVSRKYSKITDLAAINRNYVLKHLSNYFDKVGITRVARTCPDSIVIREDTSYIVIKPSFITDDDIIETLGKILKKTTFITLDADRMCEDFDAKCDVLKTLIRDIFTQNGPFTSLRYVFTDGYNNEQVVEIQDMPLTTEIILAAPLEYHIADYVVTKDFANISIWLEYHETIPFKALTSAIKTKDPLLIHTIIDTACPEFAECYKKI